MTMDTARLLYWMAERERIRLRPQAGQPAPWSNDPILRDWSFTNVRREDDRVTRAGSRPTGASLTAMTLISGLRWWLRSSSTGRGRWLKSAFRYRGGRMISAPSWPTVPSVVNNSAAEPYRIHADRRYPDRRIPNPRGVQSALACSGIFASTSGRDLKPLLLASGRASRLRWRLYARTSHRVPQIYPTTSRCILTGCRLRSAVPARELGSAA